MKTILIGICVLTAAILLGSMFMDEAKKARLARKPWYTPYLTLPGIALMLIVVALPVVVWLWKRQ